jgi:hypothetical protein
MILRNPSARHPMRSPGLATWYEAGRVDMGPGGWQTHQSTTYGIFVPTLLDAAGVIVGFDESGKARFCILIGSL